MAPGGRKKRSFFQTKNLNKLDVLKSMGKNGSVAGTGWASAAAAVAGTDANGNGHAARGASPAAISGTRGEGGTPVPPATQRKKSFAARPGGALIASGGAGIVAMAAEGLAEEEMAAGSSLAQGTAASRALALAGDGGGDSSRAGSPMSVA